MKKSRKRLIAWMLAAIMALTCGSGAAFADEVQTEGEGAAGEAVNVEAEQPEVNLAGEGSIDGEKQTYEQQWRAKRQNEKRQNEKKTDISTDNNGDGSVNHRHHGNGQRFRRRKQLLAEGEQNGKCGECLQKRQRKLEAIQGVALLLRQKQERQQNPCREFFD